MRKKSKSKEVIHYDKCLKARVKIVNQFYPKPPATIEEGTFGIVTARVLEVYDQSVEPYIHHQYQTITIKGNHLPKIETGNEYVVHGHETTSEYGVSYTVMMMTENVVLDTQEKQRAFLSQLVSERQLESLFKAFENPYEVIKAGDIDVITQAEGIGRKTAEKLMRRVLGADDLALVYSELMDYQLTQREVEQLIFHFKNPKLAVQAMKENPYTLMKVVSRVGFARCDEMALKTGMKPDSPYRVAGFIQHHLEQQAEVGNSWVTTESLLQAIDEAFVKTPISNQALSKGLKMMANQMMWHSEDKDRVGLKSVVELEQAIARELTRLNLAPNRFAFENWETKLVKQEQRQGWKYTEEQRRGIQMLLENNVSILQGYAGCVDADTEYFNGKEWKRMSEYEAGESVLQFNKDTRTGELVQPLAYIKHPQSTLYHFKTKYGLDQCLSLDHNVLYETSRGNLKLKPFHEIIQQHEQSKGGFRGKFLTTFNYSGIGIKLTDEEIRVMCAVVCDGSFNKNNQSSRCEINLKKARKKERLERLLEEAGIEYRKVESSVEGYHRYTFQAPLRAKTFDESWYECSQHQLQVIASEILNWDGNEDGTRRRFSTTNKQTADFVQFVFSATGSRTTLSIQDRSGQSFDYKGKQYTRKSVEYNLQITHRNKPQMGGFNTEAEKTRINPYPTIDGYQYCFTMPSGCLILRRNGRIFVTGNSGKTSCVAGMLAVFEGQYEVSACALSGKAAVNISEATAVNGGEPIEGKTIHRLLKVRGEEGEFSHGQDAPLPDDIIILDEVSMVGAELFLALLQAIKTGAKLIMLGDLGQLESIGKGNIMYDMVESGIIQNIFLTQIHRQASRSGIVTESIRVRAGEPLCQASDEHVEVRGELEDLVLDVYQDKQKTLPKVIDHFKKEWAKMDNIMDIMVLMPMRDRGEACVFNANNEIQQIVQPNLEQKPHLILNGGQKNEFKICVGDKVLNNKNNYEVLSKDGQETAIFNGNLGIVKAINERTQTMVVDFDLIGEVVLTPEQIKYLTLGYAMTVHKCLHKDTHVYTSIGIKTLRDYDPGTTFGESKPVPQHADVFNGSFLEKPSHFYNAGRSKCQKILTEAGFELIATLDHRLDILDEDGYVWTKPVSEIKPGDCLLIQRQIRQFGREKQEHFINFHGTLEPEIVIPRYLRKRLALALALIISGGFIEEQTLTLTLPQRELIEMVASGLKHYMKAKSIITPVEEAGETWYQLTVHSAKVCEFIRQLYRKDVFDYYFPTILLTMDESTTKEMLQLLYEGAIYDTQNQYLNLECRTERMATQIQLLLLNFGIVAQKVEVNGEYDLHLAGHQLHTFKDEIGMYLEESKHQLNEFCQQIPNHPEQEKGYGLYHLVNELVQAHQLPFPLLTQANREELKAFIHQFNDTLKGHLKFEYLKDIVMNCYLDPIQSMTETVELTYCIEMPQTHRFIQNGIRGCNCQGMGIQTVIVGLDYSSYALLTKEMVYTAITRAKQKCILVAESKALRFAIKRSNLKTKQTFLQHFLNQFSKLKKKEKGSSK